MTPSDRSEAMLAVESEMTRILRAVRGVLLENAQRFSPELQPSGYLVLGLIVKTHPLPPAEIIARMGMDKSAVSRQLRILKDLGFVSSVPDPDDRRASLYAPTELAVARMAAIREHTHITYAEVFEHWSDDDLTQFVRLLGAFTDRIERR